MNRFYTLLITAMVIISSSVPLSAEPAKAPAFENLKINGLMTYDNMRDGNIFGHYSYLAVNPAKRELLTTMPFVSANGGAIYHNGKFYLYNYDISYGFVNSAKYTTLDAITGKEIATKSVGYDPKTAYLNAATATTIDPTTSTAYACSFGYDKTSNTLSYLLTRWDLEGMTKDSIAKLPIGM